LTSLLYYRDLVRTIVPTWFRRGIAGKLFYVIALYFDALIELVDAAVRIRFPGAYGTESLPYLSRERRIRQGLGESDTSFAGRLCSYLDAHKDRGGPYPLFEQVFAHYRDQPGGAFPAHLVYTSGARFDMTTSGTVTRDAATFLTGLGPDDWAHWWLVYEWPDVIGDDGLWDDAGDWADGGVWDSDLAPSVVTDLRLIPTEWNNGYCLGHLVLLSPGEALWDVPVEIWDASITDTWDDAGSADPVTVEIE
jgi:hypothetical protein